MAVFMITSEYLALSGTDHSPHVKSAVLTVDAAQLDSTDMASGGWTEAEPGMKSGQLVVTWQDDVTSGSIDGILWGLFGTKPTFELRPTSASVGVNNPKYTGSVLCTNTSIGGPVGDLAAKSTTWPTSGAVSRATS